jgi:hypothetical protein
MPQQVVSAWKVEINFKINVKKLPAHGIPITESFML